MSERNQIIDELIANAVASGRPDRARWLRGQKTPEPKPGELWQIRTPAGHVLEHSVFVTTDNVVMTRNGNTWGLEAVTPIRRLYPPEVNSHG